MIEMLTVAFLLHVHLRSFMLPFLLRALVTLEPNRRQTAMEPQGRKRKRSDEEEQYYGSRELLEAPIPVLHVDDTKLVNKHCRKCNRGPLWQGHEYCCHLCEEAGDEHHALCSRNFLCDSDDTPPNHEVTVPMSFIRQIAWCECSPKRLKSAT